jgi:hypothetical protein
MKSATTTIGTTASLLIDSDNLNRTVYIHPNATVFIGNSTVTATSGFHCLANTPIAFELPLGEKIYAITATGTTTVLTLTPDSD